jgi:hypothetical protein
MGQTAAQPVIDGDQWFPEPFSQCHIHHVVDRMIVVAPSQLPTPLPVGWVGV